MSDKRKYTKLELRTAYGPVFRDVLDVPPRDARSDEVPIIDLADIHGDDERRRKLANIITDAAENTGFFYIKNHGISQDAIDGALKSAQTFFGQSEDDKLLVSKDKGKFFNGYSGKRSGAANKAEGRQ